MAVKFTNNAATTLAAGINSSVTSIAVTDGSVFPTITGSDHFYVTFDDTTNKEIVKVTARSGNTLTVVRGHDNTTARAFSSGDKAELRIVAALLDDVKTDVSSTLTVDTFTGNGSATAFTLSVAPASEDNLIVFIEGVYQNPGDFALSGTTLTLDVAPANGRKIIVYHVAALVSGNNLTHNQFTCNGSTTAFTLGLSPIHENNTQVFLDGVYQQKTDYAVSGTTLTMDTAPANGAILEVMTFTQTEVNTLPAAFVSGLTQVTAVGADHFMIFDATDSALKKSLVSDVLESATSISTSADATAITIDSNEKVTFTSDVTTGGHLSVGGSNNELRFYEGSNYVGFEAPALSADKIWVLPAADGSNGQVLTTNGSGTLSFADAAGGVDGIVSNADATAITIDSAEKIGMPTVASTNPVATAAPKLGINGVNAQDAQLMIHRHKANGLGPYFVLAKSQSDTNDKTIVTDGAHLGTISFQGSDGSAFQQAAQIQAQVDGTPGTNDMPGSLLFLTTTDGANTPTERMRIASDGSTLFKPSTSSDNFGFEVRTGNSADTGMKIGRTGTNNAQMGIVVSSNGDSSYANLIMKHSDTLAFNSAANISLRHGGLVRIQAAFSNDTYATHRAVYAEDQGELGYAASTRASKTNIQDIGDVSWLLKLQPKTFNKRLKNEDGSYSETEHSNVLEVGLIAEDVESENRVLCFYDVNRTSDEEGNETVTQTDLAGLKYEMLAVPLLKLVQEQQTIIDDLKSRIETLEG